MRRAHLLSRYSRESQRHLPHKASRPGIHHRRLLCEPLEDRRMLSIGSGFPNLPGLHLVDPTVDPFDGQIVYLDFDGASSVAYEGPVTVDGIDIPAFKDPRSLWGHEQDIITSVLDQLDETYSGTGLIFTTEQPSSGTDYSTVFVGGTGKDFAQHGSFLGLAEEVDVGNQDRTDNALVFSDRFVGFSTADNYGSSQKKRNIDLDAVG